MTTAFGQKCMEVEGATLKDWSEIAEGLQGVFAEASWAETRAAKGADFSGGGQESPPRLWSVTRSCARKNVVANDGGRVRWPCKADDLKLAPPYLYEQLNTTNQQPTLAGRCCSATPRWR